jgi:hypothetical protein
MPVEDRWILFSIRVLKDDCATDAQRIVFKVRGAKSNPATVVLRAGGELVVQYVPPEPKVPGFTRNDFVAKAGEIVRSTVESPKSTNEVNVDGAAGQP